MIRKQGLLDTWADRFINGGIFLIWAFLPLAYGSVHTWAYFSVELFVWILVGIWGLRTWLRISSSGEDDRTWQVSWIKCPLHVVIPFVLLFVLIQWLPFPMEWVERLSPGVAEAYKLAISVTGDAESRLISLSLYPHATRIEWIKLLTYGAFFLLVLHQIKGQKAIERFLLVWAIVALFEVFYGLMQILTGSARVWGWDNPYYHGMATGTFIYHNHYGAYLEISLLMMVGWLLARIDMLRLRGLRYESFRARLSHWGSDAGLPGILLLGFVVLLIGFAIALSGSRGAILSSSLALIIGSLFLCFYKNMRHYGFVILFIFSTIFCYANFMGVDTAVERLSKIEDGFKDRLTITESVWEMTSDFAWLGSGWGTFEEAYRPYEPEQYSQGDMTYAHNDWVQLLAEEGRLGSGLVIAGFGWFLWMAMRRWKIRRNVYSKWVGFGSIAAVTAILIHAVGDFVFRCPAVAMAWFGSLAVGWSVLYTDMHSGKTNSSRWVKNFRTCKIPKWAGYSAIAMFFAIYGWIGCQIIQHGFAQNLVLTERNSTITRPDVFKLDNILSALEFEPDNAKLWSLLAQTVVKVGEGEELEQIRGWLQNHGIVSQIKGRNPFELACAIQKEAILRNPRKPWYYIYYAWLNLGQKGKFVTAEKAVLAAIRIDPYHPEWHAYLDKIRGWSVE